MIYRLRARWLLARRLWSREGFGAVIRTASMTIATTARTSLSRGVGGQTRRGLADAGAAASYRQWLTRMQPDSEELALQTAASLSFPYQPLISFVTPVFNPAPDALVAMMDSVAQQTYTRWQLCLVDAGPEESPIRDLIEQRATADPRVVFRALTGNLGISANTNTCLDQTDGEFLIFLDHDDTTAPDLLYEIVRLLNESPETDIVYFDEDHLSSVDGRPELPLLKPDTMSPELLLSTNYLMHSAFRRRLVDAVGRLDSAYDGAQDWDLALRCAERTDRIRHVSRILYHWRRVPGSATRAPTVAGRQAGCVRAHLERTGALDAEACITSCGQIRVTWRPRRGKVSIVIQTNENLRSLKRCIKSIGSFTRYPNYEIMLVVTGRASRAALAFYAYLSRDERIEILPCAGPLNDPAANNLGARHGTGDLLLFLNHDMEIDQPDWLDELTRWAELPRIGVVGAKLLYPERRIQHAGMILGLQGPAGHIFADAPEHHCGLFGCVDWYRNYSAVCGACMMMRRDVFDTVGGFDESYAAGFHDVRMCCRVVEHGYRIVYTPFATLIGREQVPTVGTQTDDSKGADEGLQPYLERGDPNFNPNLSYGACMPALVGGGRSVHSGVRMWESPSARMPEEGASGGFH